MLLLLSRTDPWSAREAPGATKERAVASAKSDPTNEISWRTCGLSLSESGYLYAGARAGANWSTHKCAEFARDVRGNYSVWANSLPFPVLVWLVL